MSGIYIHIPFCKQACHYCNFHFSTTRHEQDAMVAMLQREIELRADYLADRHLHSIYLGGGTPSLLKEEEINALFATIYRLFSVDEHAEITLEANPDDLTVAKLNELRRTPINRLSVGIQSFFNEDLIFMNRAHNAQEAEVCIARARDAGFASFTIDLIYGSPTTTDERWRHNLHRAFALEIPHISCYCLTVEPRTALDHFVRQGKVSPVDEEQSARQFELMLQEMQDHGYEQYEISNFARQGQYAKHNTAYWQGKPYLGIGPSAHSYDGISRQWTVANNARYIREMQRADTHMPRGLYTREEIDPVTKYNEYIMTGLRTKWGVDLRQIPKKYVDYFQQEAARHLRAGMMEINEGHYRLTAAGRLIADRLTIDLFYDGT